MIVADAGPLIALARIGQLDLLRRLYGEVLIPSAVLDELALTSGRPGAAVLGDSVKSSWISEQPAIPKSAVAELTPFLGQGEAEAIVLATRTHPQFLLIDDAKGRKAARRQDTSIVGVAGVLLVAKAMGEIAAVTPILDDLSNIGYRLSARLVSEIRSLAREQEI